MNDERSVFERLDDTENSLNDVNTKVDAILKIIGNQNNSSQNSSIQDQKIQNELNNFMKRAKKFHFWFGSQDEFDKVKKISVVFHIVLIIIGILATIFTGIATVGYSTFSIFTDIFVIIGIISLKNANNLTRVMEHTSFKNNCLKKFELNNVGLWVMGDKNITAIKVFTILSIIASLGNIIGVWAFSFSFATIMSFILEITFLIMTVVKTFIDDNLYCMYGHVVIFDGMNGNNTQRIKIVYNYLRNEYLDFDEFRERSHLL